MNYFKEGDIIVEKESTKEVRFKILEPSLDARNINVIKLDMNDNEIGLRTKRSRPYIGHMFELCKRNHRDKRLNNILS